jgi:hypothetical protein
LPELVQLARAGSRGEAGIVQRVRTAKVARASRRAVLSSLLHRIERS